MRKKIKNGLILSVALLCASCQKQTVNDINEDVMYEGASNKSNNSGGCRMTMFDYYDGIADYHNTDHFTYRNGLLDEWTTAIGLVYKMEYGNGHKMVRAKGYYGGVLSYIVDFVYQNNRIVKEKVYNGDNALIGQIMHTYSSNGNMIKSESIDFGWSTTYTYNNNGDLTSFLFSAGGAPILKGDYIYLDNIKNPWQSVTGLEYAFEYVNAGLFRRKRWESSEKVTFYDQNGNPTVYYDLDPTKTIWQLGSQNYFLDAYYTDASNTISIINSADYENCKITGARQGAPTIKRGTKALGPLSRPVSLYRNAYQKTYTK